MITKCDDAAIKICMEDIPAHAVDTMCRILLASINREREAAQREV